MDRLDTWLSAQRRWRLLLVRCVALAPFGLAAGSLWTSYVYLTFDPATSQVRAMVARMALCVAASFVLAALTLLPRSWRRPARRPDRTWPTWRSTAALYSLYAAFAVSAYKQAQPLAWGWHNRDWVFRLELVLLGIFAVMMMWNARRVSRLRRLHDHGIRPGGSPGYAQDGGPH